jgi:hypothetical protein
MRGWIPHALVILLLVVACLGRGHAGVRLPKESRFGNPPGQPACWWACAETAGAVQGIPELKGILQDGPRHPGAGIGAPPNVIAEVLAARNVAYETGRGVEFVSKAVKAGKPVVIAVAGWPGTRTHHALLVLDVTDEPAEFVDDAGVRNIDRIVTLWDPNWTGFDYQITLGWLEKRWGGDAYVFSQRRQLVADQPKAVAVPVVPVRPVPVAPFVRLPSNQDLKDGVARPLDFIPSLQPR